MNAYQSKTNHTVNNQAARFLADAAKAITTDRPNTHGDARANFQCIADFWNLYLHWHAQRDADGTNQLGPADVGQMMAIFKIARTLTGDPTTPDHYTDQAGYTALAGQLAAPLLPSTNVEAAVRESRLDDEIKRMARDLRPQVPTNTDQGKTAPVTV